MASGHLASVDKASRPKAPRAVEATQGVSPLGQDPARRGLHASLEVVLLCPRAMRYESNPKHSDPWQRGRRGTLCPPDVRPLAQQLLDASVEVGSKRYATHNGVAYCAQGNRSDVWHGYPVAPHSRSGTSRLLGTGSASGPRPHRPRMGQAPRSQAPLALGPCEAGNTSPTSCVATGTVTVR